MYYALVYYPDIEIPRFKTFRQKYDPYASLMPEHVPFIFPVPETIGIDRLEEHIKAVLSSYKPFAIHLSGYTLSHDHWLLLAVKEGNDIMIRLHDHLYSGLLAPYLRDDLPYIPHVGLGLFCKEKYDPDNPSPELSLDEEKYHHAMQELNEQDFSFRCTINRLTLVQLAPDYSWSRDIKIFHLD